MIENLHNRLPFVIELSLVAEFDERRLLFKWLSTDERRRAERFVAEPIRDRFVVARGRLRIVLGRLLGIEPPLVEFEYGEFGKPFLASKHRSKLAFNVSHSQDKALIAVANSGHVGIDIEALDVELQAEALGRELLSEDELQAWRRLPSETAKRRLMQAWVCKEAIVKAKGIGWSQGMQSVSLPREFFSVEANLRKSFAVEAGAMQSSAEIGHEAKGPTPKNLFLRLLEVYPGFCGALCCDAPPSGFACASWDEILEIFPQD